MVFSSWIESCNCTVFLISWRRESLPVTSVKKINLSWMLLINLVKHVILILCWSRSLMKFCIWWHVWVLKPPMFHICFFFNNGSFYNAEVHIPKNSELVHIFGRAIANTGIKDLSVVWSLTIFRRMLLPTWSVLIFDVSNFTIDLYDRTTILENA